MRGQQGHARLSWLDGILRLRFPQARLTWKIKFHYIAERIKAVKGGDRERKSARP